MVPGPYLRRDELVAERWRWAFASSTSMYFFLMAIPLTVKHSSSYPPIRTSACTITRAIAESKQYPLLLGSVRLGPGLTGVGVPDRDYADVKRPRRPKGERVLGA